MTFVSIFIDHVIIIKKGKAESLTFERFSASRAATC